MIKKRIHIFNPEFDYAMAEFSAGYTPPASVIELRKALCETPLRYARPESDLVLLLDEVDPDSLCELQGRYPDVCILTPMIAHDVFLMARDDEQTEFEFLPWGWTPDLRHQLRRMGADEKDLPTDEQLQRLRDLADRATSIRFNEALNRHLQQAGFDSRHLSPIPIRFTASDEALRFLEQHGDVFFKYPWSSSGRGVLRARRKDSRSKIEEWLHGALRKQRSVMGETTFPKVLDFATLWKVTEGRPEFMGVSVFSASAEGKYDSNTIAPQEELMKRIRAVCKDFDERFIAAQAKAIEEIAKDYSGYLGIDMMSDADGRIRGCVELNFRMTMGIVALLEQQRLSEQALRITNIAIIGAGNVGSHLEQAFSLAGVNVRLVNSRKPLPEEIHDSDLIIISVKDDCIPDVAARIAALPLSDSRSRIVAHTSGSVPMSVLTPLISERQSIGVFYPMQTFTKGVIMRYDDIPFMIEASNPEALSRLMNLASEVSCNVMEAASAVRASYHIGAVLTCNFANHLCALADDYLQSESLDFKYLLPLLRQTISKLETTSPEMAQTGPAARGDRAVIDYHLSRLQANPHLADIYKMLSESISAFHKK